MIPDTIIIAFFIGIALLIVFTLGLLTGWMMGRRLLRSVMAAKDPTYTDSKVKDTGKKSNTRDNNRNLFHELHIGPSIPTRFETLDEEKK